MNDIQNTEPLSSPSIDPQLVIQHREDVMHQLLGVDYEYAEHEGLIDLFELDLETGDDCLLHILAGDVRTNETGVIIPGGFHHEPSAQDHQTYVDRDHISRKKPRDVREYREYPFSVYPAHVVVGGFRKMRVTQNHESGQRTVNEANNGMFPKEYDALAVMKTIRQALDRRDHSEDVDKGDRIWTIGKSVMLDGKTEMSVRLCLNKETGKIITAFPLTTKGGRLKTERRISNRTPDVITRNEILRHLGLS